ncbi:Ankyrin [Balamuthia mandrillaris]
MSLKRIPMQREDKEDEAPRRQPKRPRTTGKGAAAVPAERLPLPRRSPKLSEAQNEIAWECSRYEHKHYSRPFPQKWRLPYLRTSFFDFATRTPEEDVSLEKLHQRRLSKLERFLEKGQEPASLLDCPLEKYKQRVRTYFKKRFQNTEYHYHFLTADYIFSLHLTSAGSRWDVGWSSSSSTTTQQVFHEEIGREQARDYILGCYHEIVDWSDSLETVFDELWGCIRADDSAIKMIFSPGRNKTWRWVALRVLEEAEEEEQETEGEEKRNRAAASPKIGAAFELLRAARHLLCCGNGSSSALMKKELPWELVERIFMHVAADCGDRRRKELQRKQRQEKKEDEEGKEEHNEKVEAAPEEEQDEEGNEDDYDEEEEKTRYSLNAAMVSRILRFAQDRTTLLPTASPIRFLRSIHLLQPTKKD